MHIDLEFRNGVTVLPLFNVVVDDMGERCYFIHQPPYRLEVRMLKSVPLIVVTAVEDDEHGRKARWCQSLGRLGQDWQRLTTRWSRTKQNWNCYLRLRSS